MNKYGGINDYPDCPKKIYNLWYRMLRRCYDTEQQKLTRGKSYVDCEVCNEWKILSNFAKDITELEGYNDWVLKSGYCLDKDTKVLGNKIYSKETCCFILVADNLRDMNRRNPQVRGLHKTKYILTKDNETLYFDTEKEACEYIGVVQCSISSCYRRGRKCKGYKIAKMDGGKANGR
jgi:hypothetical protein